MPISRRRDAGECASSLKHLSLATPDPFGTSLKDVSFAVRSGEIFGIAGVSGNGQKELLAALSGERPSASRRCVRSVGKPAGQA